jgi:uncharacterized protein YggU (UPF0235/DUF167 family)
VDVPTARLRIRVASGARRARVLGRYGDRWKIGVTEAPERGRANDAVLALLAKTLRLATQDVRLVAGGSSKDKLVELRGLDAREVERRLAEESRR